LRFVKIGSDGVNRPEAEIQVEVFIRLLFGDSVEKLPSITPFPQL